MLYRIGVPLEKACTDVGGSVSWAMVQKAARKLFTTYTITGVCEGHFQDEEGRYHIDSLRFFEVQTGGDPEGTIGYRVRLFADMVRELYKQECVFVQRQRESFADLHWDEKITAVQHERE